MIRGRDSGGVAAIGSAKVRDASNALKDLKQFSIRDGSGLFPLLVSFSVVASPDDVSGYGSSSGTIQITAGASSGTVTGGTPPYTYLWQPSDVSWEAVNPTLSTSSFRSPSLGPAEFSNASFTLTVTDATSAVAVSNPVSVYATNLG